MGSQRVRHKRVTNTDTHALQHLWLNKGKENKGSVFRYPGQRHPTRTPIQTRILWDVESGVTFLKHKCDPVIHLLKILNSYVLTATEKSKLFIGAKRSPMV